MKRVDDVLAGIVYVILIGCILWIPAAAVYDHRAQLHAEQRLNDQLETARRAWCAESSKSESEWVRHRALDECIVPYLIEM